MEFSTGQLLNNRYQIEHKLGQGGMGAVYLAFDTALDNQVAVKVNRNPGSQSTNQFLREARLLASLRHPNLPRVTDYFILEGAQYLVMDYIAGKDLDTLLKEEGPQPVEQVLEWARQVGNALSFLHNQTPPIIHRDVKPANVRLSTEGEAILVDFGIAKVFDAGQATTTGAMGYTPGYAPPEQYGGNIRTGPYTDQYSLAALVYHLVSGQKPADSVQRALGRASLTPLRQLAKGVPPYTEAAINRALGLRPDARFPDIDAFLQALLTPTQAAPLQAAPVQAEALEVPQTMVDMPAIDLTLVGETQGMKAIPLEAQAPAARKPNGLLIGIIGAVVVIGLGLAAVFLGGLLGSRASGNPTEVANAGQTSVAGVPVEAAGATNTAPAEKATAALADTAAPADTDTPQPPANTPTGEASPTIGPTDTPLPSPTPPSLGGGGKIVFASNRGDGVSFQLWSMRIFLDNQGLITTSDLTQLTNSKGDKTQPAFSPDGTKLLYVSPGGPDGRTDIWMINADGSGEPLDISNLKGDEKDPAWSPDGKWIAFARNRPSDGSPRVFVMAADGSITPYELTTDLLEMNPAWTPDNMLGFVYNISGNRFLAIRPITKTNPKTGTVSSTPFYVTPEYVDRTAVFGNLGNVTEPAFSPDGKFVVYARDYTSRKRIFLAKLPLIQETLKENIIGLTDTTNDTTPAWSPDGQWIIFTSERDNGDSEIYIMNIAGQEQTNLTNFAANDKDPAWQPAP